MPPRKANPAKRKAASCVVDKVIPKARKQKTNVRDALDVGEALEGERTVVGSKGTYRSKVAVMSRYMEEHFPHCVENGVVAIPADSTAIQAFFGSICKAAHDLNAIGVINEHTVTPMSVSSVKGYRSALVDLYTLKHQVLDKEMDKMLKTRLDGYEKLYNKLKKRGLVKITEGKSPLQSGGYLILSKKFMLMEPKQGPSGEGWSMVAFSWSYFTLMWNLMSRSDSVDTIMLQHIKWENDCLIVEEQGHKGDQTGTDKFGKHVYANPTEPAICPILALATLIFSFPNRLSTGRQQLYLGTNSKDR